MRHFQALVQIDSSDPPGNETHVAEYVKKTLEADGIPVMMVAKDPARANIIARLKGNGSKRPLLIMGHSDVVRVDPAKWTFPPFSATRQGGYVYGRGTLDDKSDLLAAMMTMLMLKRQKEGESMGTPAQVEAVIALLTAAHPDQPASSWDVLREVMDDGLRSINQRQERYGPLEPHRFSLKEVNQRLAKRAERGRYRA